MNIYKIMSCVCVCFCIGCTSSVRNTKLNVDLNQKVLLDSVTEYLQLDSLILVSSDKYTITNFDRIIYHERNIYILDKMQYAVFKVNTSERNFQRIINYRGSAQNEYLCITDIAMDESENIYVFDSDSRKINQYDANGQFIKTIKVVSGTSITLSNNKIAINTNQTEDSQIAVYALSGELLYQVMPYKKRSLQYTLNDMGSIVGMKNKFLYTSSFDFNIYQANESGSTQFVTLNFGDKQFDVQKLKELDYLAYQKMLMQNSDKVMSFRNLCVYNNLIFFSTDSGEQLIYDTEQNIVMPISNVEAPYNILFSSPLSVNTDGRFCIALNNSNIREGYLPWFKTNDTKLPQLQPVKENEKKDDESFWLVMGHIR